MEDTYRIMACLHLPVVVWDRARHDTRTLNIFHNAQFLVLPQTEEHHHSVLKEYRFHKVLYLPCSRPPTRPL